MAVKSRLWSRGKPKKGTNSGILSNSGRGQKVDNVKTSPGVKKANTSVLSYALGKNRKDI